MFDITKKDNKIEVLVVLDKRQFASETKIWIRTEDVLEQIYKKYPKIQNLCLLTGDLVVSNTREPHSGSWIFGLEGEKRDLTEKTKRVRVKESTETQKPE